MFINIDINSRCTPFFNSIIENKVVTKDAVASFLDIYRNGKISDILFNVYCQYSAVDSKIWDTYEKKCLQKTENNHKVDYTERYKGIYKLNKEYHMDPYGIWIEKCKELNINPWISVRMNDCHAAYEETCFLRSDFFYEAQKNGWMLGKDYGMFCANFDYSVPQVRAKMLDYMEEQLSRYDVYGIELDFMREICCFRYADVPTDECVAIMNDFMRSVKDIVTVAEHKYGHKIKIAVRLTRDIEQSYVFGFDARCWNRENLVDVIIPSPRWKCSDNQMLLEVWKKELPGTEIIACVETVADYNYKNEPVFMDSETARGNAAILLSHGSDDLYFYNYFGESTNERDKRDLQVWQTCADLDEIYNHPVKMSLIGQEEKTTPKGFEPDFPLPLDIKAEEEKITFKTGKIPNGKEASLIIGIAGGCPSDMEIKLNGNICSGFAEVVAPENSVIRNPLTKFFKCDFKSPEIDNVFSFSTGYEGICVTSLEIYIK